MPDSDKEFIRSVVYFYKEKDDPTRYCNWDEARCHRLMPAFHTAWCSLKAFEALTRLAADAAEDKAYD